MSAALMPGPAAGWARGWGKAAFCAGHAHYFFVSDQQPAKKKTGLPATVWESGCGVRTVTNERVPMYEAGSWPRCMRCERWRAGPAVNPT